MYVDTSTLRRNGKTYTRHLLRESYRENGKVKHRTLANLSHCSPKEVEAIRLALRHKGHLTELGRLQNSVEMQQGPSVGALWVVYQVARELGIDKALGNGQQAKLALWQVMARVIDQGSRLSAVRLATSQAAGEVLGLPCFGEEELYANLDWLSEHQAKIEKRLFAQRDPATEVFLSDVTSSYLEGEQNELAAFGYNRDGKRGKRQIVIGLLCDAGGTPLSIEVFAGNTQDPKTLASQMHKAAERFGAHGVTFVGDRGMIKRPQIEALRDQRFHYITAITKTQIEGLLKAGVLQLDLFDPAVAEVETVDSERYVLRRNPSRAEQMARQREEKYCRLSEAVTAQNRYLAEHPRARPEIALRRLQERAEKRRIAGWVRLSVEGRELKIEKDQDALDEAAKLDGCYVLKTDLPATTIHKEAVHTRYKDLAQVEKAFRQSKTVHLEMRPVYVRLASRTRGHALVVMLAYRIIKELAARWSEIDLRPEEALDHLATLCVMEVQFQGKTPFQQMPKPTPLGAKLLQAARVQLPSALPSHKARVSTKAKLPKSRKAS
jgi:hypothetical protein